MSGCRTVDKSIHKYKYHCHCMNFIHLSIHSFYGLKWILKVSCPTYSQQLYSLECFPNLPSGQAQLPPCTALSSLRILISWGWRTRSLSRRLQYLLVWAGKNKNKSQIMTVNATSCTCMSSHLSCQGALSGGLWVHILNILFIILLL